MTDSASLEEMLLELALQGCVPCVSNRGSVWRAHVNGAGNNWAEATNPAAAMRMAIRLWEKAGKPMDGYAASGGW